jgi:hypothetical protein
MSLFDVATEDDSCHVTTPYYLPDNSEITLEVHAEGNGLVVVSDAGLASDQLYLHGMQDRYSNGHCRLAASRFGFSFEGGEIIARVPKSELGRTIVELTTAVQEASAHRVGRRVQSDASTRQFEFEVERYLAINKRQYERDVHIRGESGVEHRVDFRIPRMTGTQQLELALFVVSEDAGSRAAEALGYRIYGAANDIKETGDTNIRVVALIDDIAFPDLAQTKEFDSIRLIESRVDYLLKWSDEPSIHQALIAA